LLEAAEIHGRHQIGGRQTVKGEHLIDLAAAAAAAAAAIGTTRGRKQNERSKTSEIRKYM